MLVFDFHDVNTLGHEQRQVGLPLGRRLLSANIGPEAGEQRVEQRMVVVLVAVVLLPLVRDAGIEGLDGLDEGAEVIVAQELAVSPEKGRCADRRPKPPSHAGRGTVRSLYTLSNTATKIHIFFDMNSLAAKKLSNPADFHMESNTYHIASFEAADSLETHVALRVEMTAIPVR